MNTPNVSLMRQYGTDANFREKTAFVAPIAARLADIAMGRGLLAERIRGAGFEARHTMQAEMMNTAFRVLELARMEHAIDNANYSNAPIILPHNYNPEMPIGMTDGMIRIASVIGGNMAKEGAKLPISKMVGEIAGAPAAAAAKKVVSKVAPKAEAAVAGAVAKPKVVSQVASPLAAPARPAPVNPLTAAPKPGAQPLPQPGTPLKGPIKAESLPPSRPAPSAPLPPKATVQPPPPAAGPYREPGTLPPEPPAPAAAPGTTSHVEPPPAAAPSEVPVTKATPAAPEADVLGDKAKALWDRTGLSNGRYTWKVPALIAGAGATMAGLHALGKVKDYMTQENPERPYRNAGNQLAADVNQYGYAQPALPNY